MLTSENILADNLLQQLKPTMSLTFTVCIGQCQILQWVNQLRCMLCYRSYSI